MDSTREHEEFRRIDLESKIARAQHLIGMYWNGITEFHAKINHYQKVLGHIAERLGEPEPEEPRS